MTEGEIERPTAALGNLSAFLSLDKRKDQYWTSISVMDAEAILAYVAQLEAGKNV